MATYSTAFGSLPGTNEMLGTTNTTGGGQQQTYNPQRQFRSQQTTYGQAGGQPQQTFAQLQKQGMARPAPTAPQAQSFQQYGGSAQGQQMRQQLQQQLQQFGAAPSRFDTQAFQQIRGAQAANLQAEYQGQQKALNEELARRGLSASSVGGGRMGDLAGQQARALADLDAQLLQRAAETQAQDRAQLLQAGQGFAELAGAQDLSQFEANRVAQAAEFENQLRAAQFGQQQYEQGTQQALQAAQAQQSAQQFGSELGLRLGELTGQVGGVQTLAAGQQAEQRRQFDVEQQLRQFLGMGGLGLQERQQAAQEQQFGVTSAEQQRQFNIQQALQQQLGLGGLGIQQQEFGLKQQQFQQQIQDTAAERALREKLQTQELTAQEQQQLREIDARKVLQTQQLDQELKQFGLTLDETQKARAQQGGFTAQEIALKSRQIEQEGALQGRQLTLQERQNEVLNVLERDKLNADVNFRSQQLGLNRAELDMRAAQIKQDQLLRGTEITNEQAYRTAELGMRTTQVQNEFLRSGQQITLDEARLKAQKDIADADRAAQTERLTKQLAQEQSQFNLEQSLRQALAQTEATGYVYQPLTTGTSVGTLGGTQSTLARTAQEAAQTQATLDLNLRRQLGLTELSGRVYDVSGQLMGTTETVGSRSATAQDLLAKNQLFIQLAQALGALSPTQIQNIIKAGTSTGTGDTTGGGVDGQNKI